MRCRRPLSVFLHASVAFSCRPALAALRSSPMLFPRVRMLASSMPGSIVSAIASSGPSQVRELLEAHYTELTSSQFFTLIESLLMTSPTLLPPVLKFTVDKKLAIAQQLFVKSLERLQDRGVLSDLSSQVLQSELFKNPRITMALLRTAMELEGAQRSVQLFRELLDRGLPRQPDLYALLLKGVVAKKDWAAYSQVLSLLASHRLFLYSPGVQSVLERLLETSASGPKIYRFLEVLDSMNCNLSQEQFDLLLNHFRSKHEYLSYLQLVSFMKSHNAILSPKSFQSIVQTLETFAQEHRISIPLIPSEAFFFLVQSAVQFGHFDFVQSTLSNGSWNSALFSQLLVCLFQLDRPLPLPFIAFLASIRPSLAAGAASKAQAASVFRSVCSPRQTPLLIAYTHWLISDQSIHPAFFLKTALWLSQQGFLQDALQIMSALSRLPKLTPHYRAAQIYFDHLLQRSDSGLSPLPPSSDLNSLFFRLFFDRNRLDLLQKLAQSCASSQSENASSSEWLFLASLVNDEATPAVLPDSHELSLPVFQRLLNSNRFSTMESLPPVVLSTLGAVSRHRDEYFQAFFQFLSRSASQLSHRASTVELYLERAPAVPDALTRWLVASTAEPLSSSLAFLASQSKARFGPQTLESLLQKAESAESALDLLQSHWERAGLGADSLVTLLRKGVAPSAVEPFLGRLLRDPTAAVSTALIIELSLTLPDSPDKCQLVEQLAQRHRRRSTLTLRVLDTLQLGDPAAPDPSAA